MEVVEGDSQGAQNTFYQGLHTSCGGGWGCKESVGRESEAPR